MSIVYIHGMSNDGGVVLFEDTHNYWGGDGKPVQWDNKEVNQMDCKVMKSGLVVPAHKEEKTHFPPRGPMEIINEDQREATKEALVALWNVMGLTERSGLFSGREGAHDARRELWFYFAKTVLGEDCPDMEVMT